MSEAAGTSPVTTDEVNQLYSGLVSLEVTRINSGCWRLKVGLPVKPPAPDTPVEYVYESLMVPISAEDIAKFVANRGVKHLLKTRREEGDAVDRFIRVLDSLLVSDVEQKLGPAGFLIGDHPF